MIYGFEAGGSNNRIGALSKDIRVRVLNCSPIGCLLESSSPMAVGTVAALRVTFGAREFADSVRVVRCQPIVSTAGIYHVGAEFVMTAPPYAGSFRYALHLEREAMTGWLSGDEGR